MQADRDFARATTEDGVDGWLSFFSEDAMLMPAGAPEVFGRHSIRQVMEPLLSDPSQELAWEPEAADVSESGDLGYTWGKYTVSRSEPTGSVVTSRGKYATIWRRQPDGSWKVVLDIGNTSPN